MNIWLHSYQIKHSVWWQNFIFGWTVPLTVPCLCVHKCMKYTLNQYVRVTDYLKSLWSFGLLVLVIWQICLRSTLCSSPLTCIEFDYSPYTWSCCFIRHWCVRSHWFIQVISAICCLACSALWSAKTTRMFLGKTEMPCCPQCLELWTSWCELDLCVCVSSGLFVHEHLHVSTWWLLNETWKRMVSL